MKYTFSFFGIIALAISITSCQKGFAEEDLDPPGPGNDSIYLDKMYYVITDMGVTDTFGVAKFYYDASRRIKSFSTYIADGTPLPELSDTATLYYNGSDTVPFKAVFTYYYMGAPAPDVTEHFYFYDSQGRKIKDSSDAYSAGTLEDRSVYTFSYLNNFVYGKHIYQSMSMPQDNFEYRDTAVVSANGNILSNKKYRMDGPLAELSVESSFTYDNFRSPFANPALYAMFWNFPNGETLEFEYASKNNVVTQNELDHFTSPPSSFIETSTYQYTSAGFPRKKTHTNNLGGTEVEEFHFTYKAL